MSAVGGRQCLNGLEIAAAALVDAGVHSAYGVHGYPATEIGRGLGGSPPRMSWSINEKVSVEMALGVSAAGYRSAVIVKQAGMSLVLDGLANAAVHGIGGGLLVVAADDLGCRLSTVEQDSRVIAHAAGIPVLDPSSAAEVRDLVPLAFAISERSALPVLLRLSSRLRESTAEAGVGPVRPVRTARRVDPLVAWDLSKIGRMHHYDQVALPLAREALAALPPAAAEDARPGPCGVIASGGCGRLFDGCELPLLEATAVWPLAEERLAAFLRGRERVLVAEEPGDLLETGVRELVARLGLPVEVRGKRTGSLPGSGPISPEQAAAAALHLRAGGPEPPVTPAIARRGSKPPEDHPPLVAAYTAIAELARRRGLQVVADAGSSMALCHEPYAVATWSYGLGSAIGVAAGLARAGEPALAVVGDFGFVHSGLQGLMEAVHLRVALPVVIVNDFQSRRTGGQAHSITPGQPGRHTLSLRRMLEGCDVPAVETLTVGPGTPATDVLACLERAAARPGVSVALLDLE